jgi:hypothetical protein
MTQFSKSDLDGKMIAFMLPNKKRGNIGKLHVITSTNGSLFTEIHYTSMEDGETITDGKLNAQDLLSRIETNSNPNIKADFIIHGTV